MRSKKQPKSQIIKIKNLSDIGGFLEQMGQENLLEEYKQAVDRYLQKQKRIINSAMRKKLIKADELRKYLNIYVNLDGTDSFIMYLDSLLHNANIFLTAHPKLLKDRRPIQDRFGVRIISLQEAMTNNEHNDELPSYIG